jgi:hypothetical protein
LSQTQGEDLQASCHGFLFLFVRRRCHEGPADRLGPHGFAPDERILKRPARVRWLGSAAHELPE